MAQTVRDLMHQGVFSCQRETPIQEVAQQMTDHDVSALVVVEENGTLAGVISRTDLVNARLYEQYWKHWRGLTAGHIMTANVITVRPDDTIEHASKLLADKKIHRLVVVEHAEAGLQPVGVLSVTDLVRNLMQE
jgi:signal-transduction protein with cAMP-binding, CBS, and nucleotidyltransferase domain